MTYYNLVKLAADQKQEQDSYAIPKGVAAIGAGVGAGFGGHKLYRHFKDKKD